MPAPLIPSAKRKILIAVTVSAVLLSAAAVLIVLATHNSYPKDYYARKFERAEWLRNLDAEGNNPAECVSYARMAGDIVVNVVKPGMSRAEVSSLLFDAKVFESMDANPQETSPAGNIEIPLGLCELGKADSGQYIDILFGKDDRVVLAKIN